MERFSLLMHLDSMAFFHRSSLQRSPFVTQRLVGLQTSDCGTQNDAGLVDEFFIHIAPVFLGSGIRLFDNIDQDIYDIQIVEIIPSGLTTHLRYKLTKK